MAEPVRLSGVGSPAPRPFVAADHEVDHFRIVDDRRVLQHRLKGVRVAVEVTSDRVIRLGPERAVFGEEVAAQVVDDLAGQWQGRLVTQQPVCVHQALGHA